jgi:hypothetical protein
VTTTNQTGNPTAQAAIDCLDDRRSRTAACKQKGGFMRRERRRHDFGASRELARGLSTADPRRLAA